MNDLAYTVIEVLHCVLRKKGCINDQFYSIDLYFAIYHSPSCMDRSFICDQ